MVKVALEFEMDGSTPDVATRYGRQDDDDETARTEQAFKRRLAEELGGDRLAEQQKAEETREREQREAISRQRSIAQITEIGASEEEAGKLLDRIMALQPKLEQRAKELMPDNPTPEQRKAFEAVLKAEMEQAATEIMGSTKAKALIEKMERNSNR